MPQIKFERIISCSSEDPLYPSLNLLRKEGNRKWKCKKGESSVSVVIQLEKPSTISGIDIGNESSAFVEVLVGKSSSPDKFEVLLVMSSFMTPMDSRSETNRNRVRIFSKNDLSDPVCEEKWDRLKVTCTQPFNRHLQYGLSFLVLHEPDNRTENPKIDITLCGFKLKDDDDEDDIQVGSFFSRRKDLVDAPPPSPPSLTAAAAIRDAGSPAALSKHKTPARKRKTDDSPMSQKKKKQSPEDKPVPNVKDIGRKTTSSKDKPSSGSSDDLSKQSSETTKQDKKSSKKEEKNISVTKDQPIKTKVTYKPFNKLLEGVEIAISGYVNPGRADIRSKAISLGAKYKPDWCSTCTHLICAFPNTPKFNQVKGKGIIVYRDWIDECFKQRKRLYWRKFAVDESELDSQGNDSESEIWELTLDAEASTSRQTFDPARSRNAVATQDTRLNDSSGSDTDDEIRRCKVSMEKRKVDQTNGDRNQKKKEENKLDEYDCSTDVDSDDEKEKREKNWMKQRVSKDTDLPSLPDYFRDYLFYIHPNLDDDERQSLKRYIIAFGGEVCDQINERVDYIIAQSKSDVMEDPVDLPKATLVNAQWIWECNDEGKMLPVKAFLLQ